MSIELLPDPDPALAALARDLERAREPSYPLTLELRRMAADAPDDPAPALDALAAEAGYRGLGAGWVEVPRRIAAKILLHVVGGELAYPEEVVPRERAEALAERFLALFPAGARFFTNGAVSGDFAIYDRAGDEVLGWRSLSEAPLDNGVAAIGGGRVGLLWAEDAP
ncbi:MAG TPA: hypothetical protein PKD53_20400 [Chloroflexaceae bacterium]|nr:hypothetical protein [Chloroflexaceae bacterium]